MLKLNLGCGEDYREGYVNIDKRNSVNADLVCDLSRGFGNICNYNFNPEAPDIATWINTFWEHPDKQTDTIDEILANDFLEHIEQDKVIPLIDEIWRVLKPDGVFEFKIPSTDGRGAFQDPTHRSWWNINSWLYWMNDGMRKQIGAKAQFRKEILNDIPTGIGVVHTCGLLRAVK